MINNTKRILIVVILLTSNAILINGQNSSIVNRGPCVPSNNTDLKYERTIPENLSPITGKTVKCENNYANGYPCSNIDLISFVPIELLNDGSLEEANDIWGWTSSRTGIEYAIIGLETGTSFVSLEDPNNPIVLGILPTFTVNSGWRDMKTYKDYLFVVSEARKHGMQIFDLTNLDNTTSFTFFNDTAHYDRISTAHNIAINQESGYAYLVGGKYYNSCNGGLHMVDISEPEFPVFIECYGERGYTHDVQCVIYDGPDRNYKGHEICFASNEDKVDIIDVTEKENVALISSFTYENHQYVHQGWLTENHRYFLIDDEHDEIFNEKKTSTIICDVSNLSNPVLKGYYSASHSVDHNMFIKDRYVFQANYHAGLRVLDSRGIRRGVLRQVAYFDIFPLDNNYAFGGAWGAYPYFDSGLIIVSGMEQGLYVLSLDEQEIKRIWPRIAFWIRYYAYHIWFFLSHISSIIF